MRAAGAPRPVLSELAYEAIRRRIIFQDLESGETVDEMSLARELKLGRTPIREAIQRLAREGMVKVFPRRGILVADLSLETLRHVFEARAAVEEQVARCAALRATVSDTHRMREALAPVDELIDGKQLRALVEADERFHVALADAAKNPLLRGIVVTLHGLGIRFWHTTLAQRPPEDIKEEMALHREVLAAVEARDPDRAARAMLAVVGTFPDKVSEILRSPLARGPA